MAQDIPWGWHVGRAASVLVPVAWLVFRIQVDLFAWSQVNVDSVHPVRSPVREIAGAVFAFPLFYWPGLWNWFRARAGSNALVVQMSANALCWEWLLAPLVSRSLALTLFSADALAEVFWPDSGLLGILSSCK